MSEDPVVAEIHQIRQRLLEEFGGMQGLMKEFRAIEAEMHDRVVRLEPRKPVETKRRTS